MTIQAVEKLLNEVLEKAIEYVDDNFGITWNEVKQKELERRDFERLVSS